MRVELEDGVVVVRLARWEKALGLMGDIRVPVRDVSDVQLVEKPMREAAAGGLKAGLRLPGVRYVARTIALDRAFVVRRGEAGVSFAVANHDPLRQVLVSAPDAAGLAERLAAGAAGRA